MTVASWPVASGQRPVAIDTAIVVTMVTAMVTAMCRKDEGAPNRSRKSWCNGGLLISIDFERIHYIYYLSNRSVATDIELLSQVGERWI